VNKYIIVWYVVPGGSCRGQGIQTYSTLCINLHERYNLHSAHTTTKQPKLPALMTIDSFFVLCENIDEVGQEVVSTSLYGC
jgi:hypothetical protein